jgi:hypothetical protein
VIASSRQHRRYITLLCSEEYLRKLEEAKGEVDKMVADIDGEFLKAKIEVDAYHEK